MSYTIYRDKELAVKARVSDEITISVQLRNPVRYPAVNISSQPWSNLAVIGSEQYRAILGAALRSAAESQLREAIKDGLKELESSSVSEQALLDVALAVSSGTLTKEQYAASFQTSALAKRISEVAKTAPATAKTMLSWVTGCFSPRSCNLSDSDMIKLLTILDKPEYAADRGSEWQEQLLQTVQRVQDKRANNSVEDAF